MNANDLEVHGVDTLSSGATVLHPHVGDVPVGHLLIDVDLTDAVAGAADAAGVVATLHGDLVIATGRTYAPGRWQLEVPAVLLERDFRLAVHADTGDGRVSIVTVIGSNHRFTPRTSGMGALLMHQLGRAGSTMMMRLLAGHPAIAVFDDYPLETRPGLAWMHSLGVQLGATTVAPGDEPFFDEHLLAAANPYLSEYFLGADILGAHQRRGFDRIRAAVAGSVEDLYRDRRPGAVFFAEKFRIESWHAAVTQQATLATWPDTRQLVLVRDPRDLLCSRLSFNRQRAEASFDLDLHDDAVTGAPTIVHHLRLAARQVAAFPDAILVRYEDLVGHPVATATQIFRQLGLDHGYATVRAAVDHAVDSRPDGHVTTASPEASIGRWRSELPAAAAQHLVDELSSELAVFGYDS